MITMIFLQIDKQRDEGYLYQQIYKQIKQIILKRKLRKNDKLPSKRTLANQLQVSINTISLAYEQLLAEGYIYAIERSGYYVEDIASFTNESDIKAELPDDLKEVTIDRRNLLSLSHMTTDVTLFPFHEWKRCQQVAIDLHREELAHIPHFQGPYLVRESICKLTNLTRGVNSYPEQVVISTGTQPLIQQIIQLKPNLKVAIENPGYARLYLHLKQMGIQVEPISLDEKGIDIDELEKSDANVVIVTPSHQFPTGKIMPISRRIELLNWAATKDNRYIIEDDYDSEFKYETDQIPSLQSLDRNQRVIYIGTFSKSMLTSLRISYAILPIPLLRQYRERYCHIIPYNNTLTALTMHNFIESGAYTRHVKRMTHIYEEKRQLLIDELTTRFGDSISIDNIPAGLHFVAHFNTERTYEEVEASAKEEKLEVYSLKRFTLKELQEQKGVITLVIGFAAIQKEHIKEAVNKLYKILY